MSLRDQTPEIDAFSELELPPPEEVERTLDLKAEDRAPLPGLYRLNTVRTPVVRLVGFNLLLAVALLHNHLLRGGIDPQATLRVFALVEGYVLGSWLVLRLLFARVGSVHLGTVFLVVDLIIIDAVILYTGGTESLLWPVYVFRVADQQFIGRRRALGMLVASLGAYGLLLAYQVMWGTVEPAWEIETLKLLILAGLGAYLVLAATVPWNLQQRAHRARDMILRLEEQTLALNRERRRAEEASRAKSEFLARMSHELRTPLNSVIGFTTVLRKSGTIPAGSREAGFLDRIRDNGVHLLALINDILDISRIEEGAIHLEMVDVDLRSLVRSTVAQLEGRRITTAVEVREELPPGPLEVRADEARLRQVLINLLGNALKFTEEGTIRVVVEREAGSESPRLLKVVDTGIGISRERLQDIFKPFEQEDGTIRRRHPGTGLGLTISSALCRLMGFELTSESEPGKGSTFTVLFTSRENDPGGDTSTGADGVPDES